MNAADYQVLHYRDFLWRVLQIAAEEGAATERAAVSLPVVVADGPKQDREDRRLLVFVYTGRLGQSADNPDLSPPFALVQIRPDGERVEWRPIRGGGNTGPRFAPAAAGMRPPERQAFIETYYTLLTMEDGPLQRPWPEVSAGRFRDLGALFGAMAEPSLLAQYQRFAGPFLSAIRVSP